MPSKVTPDALAKKVQSQKDRFDRLEREVRNLRDVLNIHDNWNAEIRTMLGKVVSVYDTTGKVERGILKWSDRYNLCVVIDDVPRIYNKGGIIWVENE
jgi:hypothetical protein